MRFFFNFQIIKRGCEQGLSVSSYQFNTCFNILVDMIRRNNMISTRKFQIKMSCINIQKIQCNFLLKKKKTQIKSLKYAIDNFHFLKS